MGLHLRHSDQAHRPFFVFPNGVIPIAADLKKVEIQLVLVPAQQPEVVIVRPAKLGSIYVDLHIAKAEPGDRQAGGARLADKDADASAVVFDKTGGVLANSPSTGRIRKIVLEEQAARTGRGWLAPCDCQGKQGNQEKKVLRGPLHQVFYPRPIVA
jgi:hypothetical protein